MSPRRLRATDRLRRVLAILPWIAARDGPTIEEVCAQFGLDRSELLADLQVVFLVGLHPFTPDELVDVVIEDERVWIHLLPAAFSRPLRLAPDQALALVAAGAGLLSVPGTDPEGPLARGLAKLGDLLGVDAAEALTVRLGQARQEVLDVLREGLDGLHPVELDYYGFGRDRRSVRVVEPHRLFLEGGEWYLSGHCRSAGGIRLFRVDRIRDVRLRDDTFEPPTRSEGSADGSGPWAGVFHPDDDDPRVTLRLGPDAVWVADEYPCDEVEALADGSVRVRMAISGLPWLERLLLRLGPDAGRGQRSEDPAGGGGRRGPAS